MGSTTEPRRHDPDAAHGVCKQVEKSRLAPAGRREHSLYRVGQALIFYAVLVPSFWLPNDGLDLGAPCDFDRGDADAAKAGAGEKSLSSQECRAAVCLSGPRQRPTARNTKI